jgi:hypothetical protein
MYISQNYVSFYANIFGWQTNLVIRLKDVTSITKENTALVIPNAIQLNTQNEKYFFTSLVSRDSTYIMLFKLWQSSLIDEVFQIKLLLAIIYLYLKLVRSLVEMRTLVLVLVVFCGDSSINLNAH